MRRRRHVLRSGHLREDRRALRRPRSASTAANATTRYRRKYLGFAHINPSDSGGDKFSGDPTSRPSAISRAGYATFYERTRLAIARRGLIQAINDNLTSARFALVKTRQTSPTLPAAGNEGPVSVDDLAQQTSDRSIARASGRSRGPRCRSQQQHRDGPGGLLTAADAAGANTTFSRRCSKNLGTAGALLPAGDDAKNAVDAPVGLLMDDARADAAR